MKLQNYFQDKIRESKILLMILGIAIVYLQSCREKNDASKIVGNWYSFNNETVYEEIFITDSTFQTFHEYLELTSPYKYILIEDSIVFFVFDGLTWSEIDYKPKLISFNDNAFLLEFQNKFRYYKRIESGDIFINYISDDSTYNIFLHQFYNRKIKKLFEAGLTKDTALEHYNTWESSIPIDTSIFDFIESPDERSMFE